MKGDPGNPSDWLRAAGADIRRTRLMLAGGDPGGATFWTQQAAEKALKGWLIGKGWALVKTHDLSRLVAECSVLGLDLSWFSLSADRLTGLYFDERYINTTADPEADLAESSRLLAEVEQWIGVLFSPPTP